LFSAGNRITVERSDRVDSMDRTLSMETLKHTALKISFSVLIIWIVFVGILYGFLITESSHEQFLGYLLEDLGRFFIPQSLIALSILFLSGIKSIKNFRGTLFLIVIVTSTIILIFSGGVLFSVRFLLFSASLILSVLGTRSILDRILPSGVSSLGIAGGFYIAAFIPVWFLLGTLGIFDSRLIILFLLPPFSLGIYECRKYSKIKLANLIGPLNKLSASELVVIEILWLFLAIGLVWASVPETASDSIRSHLPYANNLVQTGQFERDFINWGRLMPKPVQTWWGAAISVGGYHCAKWLSLSCFFFLLILFYEETRRMTSSKLLSLISTAVLASCPYLLFLSSTLYIDHVITMLGFTSFVLLIRSFDVPSERGLLLSAFVIGCTVQTKYNGLFLGIIWIIILTIRVFQNPRFKRRAKTFILLLAVSIITASPWYIWTYTKTGNPVYPYFGSIFESPYWPKNISTSLNQEMYSVGERAIDYLQLPWSITFDTSKFSARNNGILGFSLLALLPFSIFMIFPKYRKKGKVYLIIGIAVLLFTFIYTLNVRYWLLGYPFIILGLFSICFHVIRELKLRIGALNSIIITGSSALFLLIQVPFWTTIGGGPFNWSVYSKRVAVNSWMEGMYPGYNVVQEFNKMISKSDRVICSGYEPVYTINAISYELPFWHLNILQIENEKDFREFILANKIKYWIVDWRNSEENEWFDKRINAREEFWKNEKIVIAKENISVYDLNCP